MGRRSRKNRLVRVREPTGRVSRAGHGEPDEFPPAQVRRLRDAALAGLRDAEWGTELGWLLLRGRITAGQYAAGKWWREQAAKYGSAIEAPKLGVSGYERGSGRSVLDPDSADGVKVSVREVAACRVFLEAHANLLGAGHVSERVVRDLCEHDMAACGVIEEAAMQRGLLWLAQYRGLTEIKKRSNGR